MLKRLIAIFTTALCACTLVIVAACGEEPAPTPPDDGTTQVPDGGDPEPTPGGDETPDPVYVTVTFKQEGQADVVKTVEQGTALTDIPTPASKTGYNITWSVTDFTSVTESLTVNAVERAKTYTVTFETNGGIVVQPTVTVTYGEEYSFADASHIEYDFIYWKYNGEEFASEGTWNTDVEGTIVLVAQWSDSTWTGQK